MKSGRSGNASKRDKRDATHGDGKKRSLYDKHTVIRATDTAKAPSQRLSSGTRRPVSGTRRPSNGAREVKHSTQRKPASRVEGRLNYSLSRTRSISAIAAKNKAWTSTKATPASTSKSRRVGGGVVVRSEVALPWMTALEK